MNALLPFPNSMKLKAPSFVARAFSLVELLVVVAVIAIIAGFAVPAVTTMIRGSQLTQGSQMVLDQMSLARQTALAKNRPVDVRFYKFADPETPGETPDKPDTGYFRALQVFEILDNGGALPLGPIQRLPVNVIMNEKGLSTLLNEAEPSRVRVTKPLDSDPEMPDNVVKKNYHYMSLRFQPDGSTDLPQGGTVTDPKGDSWYVTLVNATDANATTVGAAGSAAKPAAANYFTLQVDPITGTTRPYRPNLGN